MRLVASTSARARLQAARLFIDRFPHDTELLIVAATRGAADDFVRELAHGRATFGWHRFSLTELAARAAAVRLAEEGRVPATATNAEAVAARAAFDARTGGELTYFAPVAAMPGFPRALARTIHELRLAGASARALERAGAGTADVARLLTRIEDQLQAAGVEDRAALFEVAASAWTRTRWRACPVLMLDVPFASAAEGGFALTVCVHAPEALATVADGDEMTRQVIGDRFRIEALDDDAPRSTDLGRLRRHIFELDPPPERSQAGDVRLFSAPGEAREALEIARRVLDEAGAGLRFDEIAVCLRAPQQYVGLLEHAFGRAGIPAYFDRGTRRPDPSGRAFIALLACACEKLSARRFDEYLSLGEVPRMAGGAATTVPNPSVAPDDEAYARFDDVVKEAAVDDSLDAAVVDADEEAVIAGALRAPWKWEELIVESAVIGGVSRADGKARWRRRLDGLAADYTLRLAELMRDEPDSPRVAALKRNLRNLRHLREFALPIVDRLGDWPAAATWGDWLDRLVDLAPRVLRRPDRVLRVLADLRPMAEIGPVPLEEVRDRLQPRLLTLDWHPPSQRYGRVFVGTPHQTRGRAFRVVFVPGLAERIFPQRVHEDPLLPDEARAATGAPLVTRPDRTAAERLLLRLAIGAATDRVYLSYPRLGAEMGDMRPRVPSFYALDVMRAITGCVPDHRTLAADAASEADATLAWPAPRDPTRAVDDLEHDLAVLGPLIESRDPGVKGHARYLLELNGALRRSVISRWARWEKRWSASDGLIRVTPATAPALAHHRLRARPYSLSALQRFASCPYQFLLSAIHRIEPWEEPQPLVRMDPLTRGSLFHRVQAETFRALHAVAALPVTAANLGAAVQTLHGVIDRVAAQYEDDLAPAIARVWRDEIADIRRDLGIWLRRLSESSGWIPEYFEFSFGLNDEGRDPRSLKEPVAIDHGFVLRGSVDLIERSASGPTLRITDHKTGRNRTKEDLIVGGGETLQPVLYSVAMEHGLQARVESARLYFCTTAGGFAERPVPIDDYARGQGLLALTIIDRAIELGQLPAAPRKDACRWCDFRPVCGPDEERRVAQKPAAMLSDLHSLRELR